jgi:hypothetical protein
MVVCIGFDLSLSKTAVSVFNRDGVVMARQGAAEASDCATGRRRDLNSGRSKASPRSAGADRHRAMFCGPGMPIAHLDLSVSPTRRYQRWSASFQVIAR